MERFSLSIFRAIQIHVEDSPRLFDPSKYEKGIRRKLQRVCYQMEEYGINGPTTPYQSRRKFHVRGHSTLSILWHVGCQYFCGVRGLDVFCRKNQRGKIADTRASMMEKKKISPDRCVQTVFGEIGSKRRSHTTQEESVKNYPRSPWYAQVPLVGLHSPQRFAREYDQESDSSCP